MMDQNDNKLSLSNIYASIIQQTSSMIIPWPDSDGFAKCCLDSSALSAAAEENTNATTTTTSSSKNSFQVPTFPEGTGPLGVFALTTENTHPGTEKLVQTCLDAFDQFCEELNAIATTLQHNNNSNNDDDENNHKGDDDELFFWVKSLVPHITIAIFQEHPQLLPKMTQEELDEFYFFTNDDGDKLAQSLAKQTFRYSPIQLTLDSLILTPDGAMIAGFVDDDDNNNDDDGGVGNNYYDKLKTDIVTDAKQVMGMGEFTSRPKNLIHITCGRVVRKQGAALELFHTSTQADIQKLVERYNKQVFPQLVADMKGNDNGGTLLLEQLTLLRNDVWLCEKNTVYGVGKLQGPDDSKSVS